jgi:hypothetical protein
MVELPMKNQARLISAVSMIVIVAGTFGVARQTPPLRTAEPREPLAAIFDVFQSHNVVALDEGAHGNEQGHALRLKLIRDPRFPASVNDIVVEFGNSRYQDLMDRFIRGEQVPDEQIRAVWQNTTQNWVWDRPIYEEFFRAVRGVNAKLPPERQVRVLLGDPPIDWAKVRSASDHFKWLERRDRAAAEIVDREVLAKGRKALLIFGAMHLQRKHVGANYEPLAQADTLVSILGRSAIARIFTIWTHTSGDLTAAHADVNRWPVPSLAIVRGTTLGATDFGGYLSSEMPRFAIRDGKPVPLPRDQWRTLPMEQQFDAVLYLGPPSAITTAKLPAALCADQTYMKMRIDRLTSIGQQAQVKSLNEECGIKAPQ